MSPYELADGMLAEVYEASMEAGRHRDVLEILERINSEIRPSICQLFDADRVISPLQVVAAATSTILSFKSGRNVAKRFEMELLVRLSAQDQIHRAIETVGISERTRSLGVCIISRNEEELMLSRSKAERLLGLRLKGFERKNEGSLEELIKIFGVSEEELMSIQAERLVDALELIILERIALSLISR